MSELKIMSHLGPHLNVVNLLGACTKGGTKTTPPEDSGKCQQPRPGPSPPLLNPQTTRHSSWRVCAHPALTSQTHTGVGFTNSQNHNTFKAHGLLGSFPNPGGALTFFLHMFIYF